MKYFVKLHTGEEYEIDKLDYNHIKHRINTGRTNGFYAMRGTQNPNLKFSFKYFMCLNTTGTPKPKDEIVRKIDPEKFAPTPVGKPLAQPKGCGHDWQNPDDWEYVQKNVNGKLQYRKQCYKCKKVSPLLKPQEVKNEMEALGKTLEDVPFNTTV